MCGIQQPRFYKLQRKHGFDSCMCISLYAISKHQRGNRIIGRIIQTIDSCIEERTFGIIIRFFKCVKSALKTIFNKTMSILSR